MEENPIPSMEYIKNFFETLGVVRDYAISKELHESGKIHYHAVIVMEDKYETTNEAKFDLEGVHPNIKRLPTKGDEGRAVIYVCKCMKDGEEWLSTFDKKTDPFAEAWVAKTWLEARDILMAAQPKWLFQHMSGAEKHWRTVNVQPFCGIRYFGPYLFHRDLEWTPYTHTMVLKATPGVGKTQWAKYYFQHMFGDFHYVKGTLSGLRHIGQKKSIILDDIEFQEEFHGWNALTDIESGGSISARYADVHIEPGIPRIIICNQWPDWGNNLAVERRVQKFIELDGIFINY